MAGRDSSLSALRGRSPTADGSLEHFSDPAYYDQAYASRTEDVEFYRAQALASRGPVLEYGVGTGRVALALARAGISVVGVDASAPMLRAFEEKSKAEPASVRSLLTLRRGDMRSLRLGLRFPLVIAPFNVILHLYTRTDVERFFARVKEHLTPRGRFVFDFSLPRPEDLALDSGRWYGAPRFKHPSGKLVRYAESFAYDSLAQTLRMSFRFTPVDGSPSWETPLEHRQFFPQEMEALLHYNGFHRMVFGADFSFRSPDDETDSIVVECRARTTGSERLRAAGSPRRTGRK